MFVPPARTSEEDKRELARDGDLWNPGEKARAIFLERNHALFMSPRAPIVHSVSTVSTSLMEGGMVWDALSIVPTLETLYLIEKNSKTTNNTFPHRSVTILEEL